MMRPVPRSVPGVALDRLEQRPLLSTDTARDDVVVLQRSVHRQIMADLDTYRTSLLHLQQVLLQQV